MTVFKYIILVALAYLLGSVSMSYIVGKYAKGVDIRTKGSGNLGSTNALRVLGWKCAAITVAYDILKGVATIWIADLMFDGQLESIAIMLGGIAVIAGHNFPFYLKFKGGKGIATSFGIALYLNPIAAVALLIIEFGIIFSTGYVSLASVISAAVYPFLVIFLWSGHVGDVWYWILCVVLAVLAIYRHRSNIKRLIDGNENRFTFGKKNK